MENRINIERYKKIVTQAKLDLIEASKIMELSKKSPEDKTEIAKIYAEKNDIVDPEEKYFYITEFLIPDNDFVNVFLANKKSASETAKHYGVEQKIVAMKTLAVEKYKEFKKDTNQEDISDEEKTANAISKISKLLELNSSQEKDIGDKDEQIFNLEEELKKKDTVISSLKQQIDEKEKQIKELEEELSSYKEKMTKYLTYKENYDKIITFLDDNLSQSGKKPLN